MRGVLSAGGWDRRKRWIRVSAVVGIVSPIGTGYVGICLAAGGRVGPGYVGIGRPGGRHTSCNVRNRRNRR